MPRLTRAERSEQIRRELVTAAHDVFMERGFHGASLDEISDRAGYTRGAVYSGFDGKEGLFLAVVDEYGLRRMREAVDAALAAPDFEAALRATARDVTGSDPSWVRVLMEFWTHASKREDLREAARQRHERALDTLGEIFDELATRHGVAYRLPARDLARGHLAFVNGMKLERALDAPDVGTELFERLFCAFVTGLTVPAEPKSAR